ncbi:MAG TPA: polysaccharide biosynthesis/export family protein [Terriglobia bacterium]|nr:polysaccharide biosynthesis/export family protein [Terriglobia bacterium]
MMSKNLLLCVITLAFGSLLAHGANSTPSTPAAPSTPSGASAATVPAAGATAAPVNAGADSTDTPSDNPAVTPLLERRNPRYRIEIGDVVGLDFPFTPEYDENVTVQPDGYISLITLGDMHVEGMTLPELTKALRQSYSKILHDPIVTVALSNFEQPYFIVGGEVGKPGKYDLHGDTTLIQAVEIAGGFTYTSKHSHVLLFRRVSDDWVSARVINVKKMLSAGNLAEDLHIEPGDMVFIPKNRLSKVQPYLPYLLPYQLFRINFNATSAFGY